MSDPLHQFLEETRDTREYRRAVAVQMARQGIDYDTITAVLSVSKAFISKWIGIYAEQGVAGLRMGYHGSVGYLTTAQREQTIAWLRAQESWSVPALQAYLQETFQVVYQSLQSYYDLLHAAGLSWKKTQATNPKKTTR
jgi:transposase